MLTVADLHHQAMRKAAEGDRMARRGQKYKAKKWWKYAARQEEAAFRQLDPVASDEPTRCILAVSAATLWWCAARKEKPRPSGARRLRRQDGRCPVLGQKPGLDHVRDG